MILVTRILNGSVSQFHKKIMLTVGVTAKWLPDFNIPALAFVSCNIHNVSVEFATNYAMLKPS